MSALWQVLRAWTWKHTLWGLGLGLLNVAAGPGGGMLLWPTESDKHYLAAIVHNILLFGLPIVGAARMADIAVDSGRSPWLAYGTAALSVAVLGSWGGWLLSISIWGGALATQSRNLWLAVAMATLYGFGIAIYSHWRREQQAMARLHGLESARAQKERLLQRQRLLALQARVEPRQLFDALRRVMDALPARPAEADALLALTIAQLRAMADGASPGTPRGSMEGS